jgi:5-methylcytosine-specific restriction protein A
VVSERGTPVTAHANDVLIAGAYITDEAMQAVLERQCNRCAGCNAPLSAGSTHFDLRQPAICGGSHTLGNIEALCPFCHRNRMRRIREQFAGMIGHKNK